MSENGRERWTPLHSNVTFCSVRLTLQESTYHSPMPWHFWFWLNNHKNPSSSLGKWSWNENQGRWRPNSSFPREHSIPSFVNYKLVFAKGICHLPLQGLNLDLLQLLTFNTPWRQFGLKTGMRGFVLQESWCTVRRWRSRSTCAHFLWEHQNHN